MPGPLDPSLRLSADLITGQGLNDDSLPPAHWRIGEVTSVGTGTAAVTIGGVSLPVVRFIEGVVPEVGQLVMVMIQGPDHFIVGARSTTSDPMSGGTTIPMCRRTRDTAASITSGSVSGPLGWNILDYDTDGMALSSSIIIQTPGVYKIGYRVTFDTNTTGRRVAIVQKNAVELIRDERVPNSGAQAYCEGHVTLPFVADDDLTLHAFQTSGVTLGTSTTSYQRPWIEAIWQGTTS